MFIQQDTKNHRKIPRIPHSPSNRFHKALTQKKSSEKPQHRLNIYPKRSNIHDRIDK